ncbi:MAG: DUF6157 family protein [Crocinitomicaceae bacterium]
MEKRDPMHTTNYFNTFILLADDCSAREGIMPTPKGDKKTVANLQFEMVYEKPYAYTSDEVLFAVFAQRKGFLKGELDVERETYFSKGQPCFRASPLTKRYGWGVHFNADGKMALFSPDSSDYQQFLEDDSVKKVKAMRNKRA